MMGGIAESFLWSPNAPEFIPYDSQDSGGGAIAFPNNMSANRSVDSGGGASLSTELSAQQAEAEIYPFLWDIDRNKPSRTVCILRVGWLRAPDVRSACEAYGVLDSFRADFSSRGIYFCSYYDIRSAQYAAVELQSVLQRMMVLQRSSDEVVVRYCLPLNSSSQFDESQLSIADLPPHVDEPQLASMLNSYGAVRSVFPNGVGSFLVEFYSVQDAKQALLELDSSQPWGRNVAIETGVRNPVERKRGRELLATLSRWRQQMSASGGGVPSSQASNQQLNIPASEVIDPWAGRSTAVRGAGGVGLEALNPIMTAIDSTGFAVSGGGGIGDMFSRPQNATPQLVLGQDGRYQVVMPATAHPSFGGRQAPQQLPQAQQIVQGPNGQLYVIPVSGSILQQTSTPRIGNFHQQSQQQRSDPYDRRPPFGIGASMPYYTHVVAGSDGASLGSRSSYRSNTSANEDKDNRHLMLDLEEVESGIDTRTSLMVRNIPNKYTQQMLLSEFEENGHGPGVIDFFYLPIDFKNRCNRGYAFINFVDYKDILTFHRRYFGKHWRTFNSDKICDITYARIQGKAAMLKRFENSALMEKDDEYKPLVFVSDGPNKGQRLPFPGPSSSAAVPHLHHQLLPQQQQQQQQHPAS
jgi:RNA recognition motif-containing protein